MTGEYFQLGGKRHKKRKKRVLVEERTEAQIFLKNAHYLFEHCDDILNDSRLFQPYRSKGFGDFLKKVYNEKGMLVSCYSS